MLPVTRCLKKSIIPPSDKPDSSSNPGSKSEAAFNSKAEDIYEFKTTALTKEGPLTGRTASPAKDHANLNDKTGPPGKDDKEQGQQQAGDKRGHDNDDDEETR